MARRLPWRVAVRSDRKAILTTLGVAMGVVFAIVGLAIPQGLRTVTLSEQSSFHERDAIVSMPGGARFDPATLRLQDATSALLLDAEGRTFATFTGPRAPAVANGTYRVATDGPAHGELRVANATLAEGEPLAGAIFARGWIVIAPRDAELLAPSDAAKATYVLVPRLASGDADRLVAQGFEISSAPAVEPFFVASAAEVSSDLILVVLFSSTLVVVFVYEFLRSDVRERRREIGLWRALGMHANDVLALVLARAAAVGAAGLAVGIVVASLVLGAAGLLTHAGIFALRLSLAQWALISGGFLLSALAGGAVPAWSASRGLVREQLEAAP